jgi:CelD/BcsL family acetyltransferase involved in cellulose biosynthesis
VRIAETTPGEHPAQPTLTAEDNPFFSPGILKAALDQLADAKVTTARVTATDGRLVALAPIRPTRLGRLVPAISVWVHSLGPLGTPLLDTATLEKAAAGLIAAMDGERPGHRILEFPYLPLEGPVATALRQQAAREQRPVAVLAAHQRAVLNRAGPDGNRFLNAIAPKKRKELARQLRRLRDLGAVTIEHVTEPAALAAALEDFFALEASGWKGERGTALTLRFREKAFAKAAVASGDTTIHALRLDGRAVAMLVSFQSGAGAITWKIAYDEAYARFSPGVQIMLEASTALLADPTLERIDSLAIAGHPMIDPLWPDRMSVGTLVIGPKGGGIRYEAGLALARLELNLRPIARRFVHTVRKRAEVLKSRLRRSASAASPEG